MTGGNQPEVDALLAAGHRQLLAGDGAGAARTFLEALRHDLANGPAHYLLGTVRYQQSDHSQAIVHFQKAVQLVPGSADVVNGLASALLAAGRRAEAERAFQRAVQLDPANLAVWLNSGEQFTQERRFAEAQAAYRRAQQLAPEDPRLAEGISRLGQAASRGGRGMGPGYPSISVIVHTRNEEAHIEDCLRCLLWADELIVADMASEDRTVEIARRYADRIIGVPRADWVEGARAQSAAQASHDWLFFVDADERVPAKLVPILYFALREYGDQVAALSIPFKQYFMGKWVRLGPHWPGYKQPPLLNRRRIQITPHVHRGFIVLGQVWTIRADDPSVAIDHYSHPTLFTCLNKFNVYTNAEVPVDDAQGSTFHWRDAAKRLAQTLSANYDRAGVPEYQREPEDFFSSFMYALYPFLAKAKLYEEHARTGRLLPEEGEVPSSTREFLEEMLRHVP